MIDNQPSQKAAQPATAGKAKRQYQKPAFRHERVFETQALTCGKVGDNPHSCQLNQKTS
jgi:hypothetical protein